MFQLVVNIVRSPSKEKGLDNGDALYDTVACTEL
jgi:hypothetical protein